MQLKLGNFNYVIISSIHNSKTHISNSSTNCEIRIDITDFANAVLIVAPISMGHFELGALPPEGICQVHVART